MSKAVESEGRKDLTVMVAGKNSSGSPQPWMNPWSASVPLLMPHVASSLPFLHLHVASNHNKGDPVFRLSSLARIPPRGSENTISTPIPTLLSLSVETPTAGDCFELPETSLNPI